MQQVSPLVSLGLVLASSGLLACSGGSGGGSSTQGALAHSHVLVSTLAPEDLSSLDSRVSEVRLVRPDGTESDNLLSQPLDLEMTGLENTAQWIANSDVEAGLYDSLRLRFEPGSVSARSMAGTVPVEEDSLELEAPFASPLDLGAGEHQQMHVQIDLASTIDGDVETPPVVFSPEGAILPPDSVGIDEFRGIVTRISPQNRTLDVDAFLDKEMQMPLGPVKVRIDRNTVLVDDNDVIFPTPAAFYSSLRLDMTVLEIYGDLGSDGRVIARRLEIEDQAGGTGDATVVIQGRVLYLDRDTSRILLLIRDIEMGAAIAEPVLASLGNPLAVEVLYDDQTRFLFRSGGAASADNLRIGQALEVGFEDFQSPPFLASQALLDSPEVDFQGTIVDNSGLPESVVVSLGDDDLHFHGWQFRPNRRDVLVKLGDTPVTLEVHGRPTVGRQRLAVGMRLKVTGNLTGLPDTPTIDATRLRLRPGRFDKADVATVDEANASFTTSRSRIKKSFGVDVGEGPLNVRISPQARFEGDASNQAEFFRAVGASHARRIDVRGEGVGSGVPNEVIVYELRLKVRGGGHDDDEDDDDDEEDDD